MKQQGTFYAAAAVGLILAISIAQAKSQADMEREIAAFAAKEVHPGDTPQQITTFLKAHNFYPTEYAHKNQKMLGHAMYGHDGAPTADPQQAAFGVSISFRFNQSDLLQDYEVDVQKIGH